MSILLRSVLFSTIPKTNLTVQCPPYGTGCRLATWSTVRGLKPAVCISEPQYHTPNTVSRFTELHEALGLSLDLPRRQSLSRQFVGSFSNDPSHAVPESPLPAE
ncbi:hypothetical protein CDEST_07553 [Colletotrichum destructivum]|uniref:Uncharacterized protein n=1 Tax=Colletotrichum destructivum TaxID=34406 RepID=A0AAX4IIB3_9PEZI|nr:hypothetical protein CDEST_07553 [Colletotrichum destructivum]